jgi:sulfate adenylyltransferase
MELIAPYGGKLISLVAGGEEKSDLVRRAAELSSLQLTARSLCDLELLATGAFSPLDRFMGRVDAERVTAEMRLAGGTLFPIPITLSANQLDGIAGKEIALRTPKNNLVGWMKVEEVFEWSYAAEARQVFGAMDDQHPLVAEMRTWGRYRLSGPLRVLELPQHPDFPSLRRTPAEVRALLATMGQENVVAFQPRNPVHRVPEEITRRAVPEVDGSLLIQLAAGMTQPGDFAHYTRVRTYKRLVENHYDANRTLLNLLPLATRLAGPREALWHAIVQRNFGANYFLVGDEARESRELLIRHSAEIGVQAMPYRETIDLPDEDRDEPALALPRQGFCIWFTGLPSSGKSTVAEALMVMLMEHGRQVTMLDGDVVRTHLSKGLTFSREDRDTNILRVGFVASEIVRHNGAVICAAVSPYRHTRNQVRAMVANHASHGDAFIEVFVDTPVEECERRDVKGFYAQARDGKIKGFTGVDDPYEPPLAPEIRLSTTDTTAAQNAGRIVEFLRSRGLLI